MDRLVNVTDTSLATLARQRFLQTGERTSPYLCRPERETYTETETYEREDGTQYSRTRTVSRWGGSYSEGEWVAG
jgi:hypothetical protein